VKRLVTIATLAVLLAGLVLVGLSDMDISAAETNIPDNEASSSVSNSSASAMIMIAWTTPSGEGGSNEL